MSRSYISKWKNI